ncbi:arsenate reductase (glutaredoxin) [Chitinimonas sp.]|uniref:arsenate reductase (glutaredoxin) n=1 Tax=Chitinimonas sp. TaxID=1934313 RepID=UPI002F952463
MNAVIYHNARCSKSRETLALLEQQGVETEVVYYLETPPDVVTLERLLSQLGFTDPRQLMRQKEDEYAALDLANPARSRSELLAAMVAHPRLIERPIVVVGERAVLGRPPEAVLVLLSR